MTYFVLRWFKEGRQKNSINPQPLFCGYKNGDNYTKVSLAIGLNSLNAKFEAFLKLLCPNNNFDLQEGVKYSNFIIKLNGYKTGDWEWLLSKI